MHIQTKSSSYRRRPTTQMILSIGTCQHALFTRPASLTNIQEPGLQILHGLRYLLSYVHVQSSGSWPHDCHSTNGYGVFPKLEADGLSSSNLKNGLFLYLHSTYARNGQLYLDASCQQIWTTTSISHLIYDLSRVRYLGCLYTFLC